MGILHIEATSLYEQMKQFHGPADNEAAALFPVAISLGCV